MHVHRMYYIPEIGSGKSPKLWSSLSCSKVVNFHYSDTTDVQRAEAIFFENRLFLRCSFASSSQARGCAVILTLTGSTETERFDLSIMSDGSASLCAEANNQREAYSSVEALDVEANGSDGVVRLYINSTVTVLMNEGEFIDMTGCRQPSKTHEHEYIL